MTKAAKVRTKGELIQRRRAEAGYSSQEEFALEAGIALRRLRDAEKGRYCTPATVHAIASILPGVLYEDLIETELPSTTSPTAAIGITGQLDFTGVLANNLAADIAQIPREISNLLAAHGITLSKLKSVLKIDKPKVSETTITVVTGLNNLLGIPRVWNTLFRVNRD